MINPEMNDHAAKYYKQNLPLLLRDFQEGDDRKDGSGIPVFDPEKVAPIPAERLKRLHKLLLSEVEYQGKNFSHTQKKLLQVGKAILARPNVLLLDSNFFKVEEALEQVLFELIFTNLKTSSIVAILERYEMLQYFDRVLVLENGSLVEEGNPDNLFARKGPFRRLIEMRRQHDKKLGNNTKTHPRN